MTTWRRDAGLESFPLNPTAKSYTLGSRIWYKDKKGGNFPLIYQSIPFDQRGQNIPTIYRQKSLQTQIKNYKNYTKKKRNKMVHHDFRRLSSFESSQMKKKVQHFKWGRMTFLFLNSMGMQFGSQKGRGRLCSPTLCSAKSLDDNPRPRLRQHRSSLRYIVEVLQLVSLGVFHDSNRVLLSEFIPNEYHHVIMRCDNILFQTCSLSPTWCNAYLFMMPGKVGTAIPDTNPRELPVWQSLTDNCPQIEWLKQTIQMF